MAKLPAWHVVETLCDQAMAQHPSRVHEGRSYATRVYQPAEPSRAEDHTPDLCIGNADLFMPGLTGPAFDQIFAATSASSMGLSDFYACGSDGMDLLNMNGEDDFPSLDI